MLATDIQKNISYKQTPKRQKKFPLFSLKKSKKKSNLQSQSKNQKKNFFQKKLKRFHKSKLNLDVISLETNSTINTLEEENFNKNEEMIRYFNEIEFVMKDICEKGFYSFENLEKVFPEKKVENNEYKKGNVKYINQNFKNIYENVSPNEKIKLILDIDETLVYSKVIQEIQKIPNENLKINPDLFPHPIQNVEQDEFLIQIFEKTYEKNFLVKVKIRKGLALFFKKLFPFCEFYINTMASKPYVIEILKILEKYYDFYIKEENVMFTSPQRKKNLDDNIIKEENFLILDDNICAWEMRFIPAIIPVKKFNDLNINDIFYQYYLFSNKIYCFNETKGCFVEPKNKIPHCVEFTNTEKNIKSQLNNITEIIIKSFLLKKILNIPIRHCLHFIQNTILKNCKIYYQGLEVEFISEMINFLGGIVINDLNDIQNVTHIIYNKNFLTNEENARNNLINIENKDLFFIDIKWIFDCFFKFKKCDEMEVEYKMLK